VTYRVIWVPVALQLLADVWLASTNRNAVTRATHEIDQALELFPNSTGELLFDTVREYDDPFLTVEFEVDDVNRRVYVLKVWETAAGRPPLTGG
jgi:hypothetical protein